jgi:hypothetical protein
MQQFFVESPSHLAKVKAQTPLVFILCFRQFFDGYNLILFVGQFFVRQNFRNQSWLAGGCVTIFCCTGFGKSSGATSDFLVAASFLVKLVGASLLVFRSVRVEKLGGFGARLVF